jgi:cytoskeleton protein RodZ
MASPVESVAVPVQPVPVASAAPGGPLLGVLVLRSKGEAWVEVVDAQGQVQVRRTLAPGESAAVSGPLPLSVVVGRADVTEVEIRGKAFSLDAISKSNVARFEVK